MRWWAFWRRAQYILGCIVFVTLIFTGWYFMFGKVTPTCSDGVANGAERGIDCGGDCIKICVADVLPLTVLWAESFKIVDGQYNAVAYLENRNRTYGTPRMEYVFRLYDERGLITERSGATTIPIDGVYPLFEGKIFTNDRIPTRTEVLFGSNATWLEGTAGSEQLSLVRRDLVGADSLPRLITEIRNDGLFEAQNIEIVATIFDSQKRPLTASKTTVEYFAGRSTQKVVFTWPEPIATTLRSCEVPTDVMLAIDLSGSMNDDGGTPPEPITSVLKSAESFVERLNPNDQSGLVTYATQAEVKEQLTRNNTTVAKVISNLTIAPAEEVGSTNTGDAIKLMREEMLSNRHNENARKVAILLTDGLANTPGTNPEEYAINEATLLKEAGTNIFTIGLGAKVNETFLKTLASKDSQYYFAPSIGQLQTIYAQITDAICEDGAAVIEVIPKVESNFPVLNN